MSGTDRKQEEAIRVFLKKAKKPDIDERRKRQTLELLRTERKHLRVRWKKPYRERVLEQAAYLSPAAWIAQGILALALGWLFYREDREVILMSLMFAAPVMGIVGFTELLRSYRQNMWELEQACRYNLRQLMGMRLLIFGTADSLVAAGVIISGFSIGLKASELLLFFLLPQVLSDCVYLYLMARFRRQFQGTALIGAAVALAVVWTKISQLILGAPRLLERLTEPMALLFLALISAGLLTLSCVRFLKETEFYGEPAAGN